MPSQPKPLAAGKKCTDPARSSPSSRNSALDFAPPANYSGVLRRLPARPSVDMGLGLRKAFLPCLTALPAECKCEVSLPRSRSINSCSEAAPTACHAICRVRRASSTAASGQTGRWSSPGKEPHHALCKSKFRGSLRTQSQSQACEGLVSCDRSGVEAGCRGRKGPGGWVGWIAWLRNFCC